MSNQPGNLARNGRKVLIGVNITLKRENRLEGEILRYVML